MARTLKFSLILQAILAAVIFVAAAGRTYYAYEGARRIDDIAAAIRLGADGRLSIDDAMARGLGRGGGWFLAVSERAGTIASGAVPACLAGAPFTRVSSADFTCGGRAGLNDIKMSQVRVGSIPVQLYVRNAPLLAMSEESDRTVGNVILILGALLWLLAIGFVGFATFGLSRSVKALSDVTRRTDLADPTSQFVELSTADLPGDIVPLIDALNRTFRQIRRDYINQGTFLRDAAHELKTPIAILGVRIQSIDEEALRSRLLRDLNRLTRIIEQLVEIQRNRGLRDGLTRINLAQVVREAAEDIAPLVIESGYRFELDVERPEVFILGDPQGIQRAVLNLVQNAVLYGGGGGTIGVKVYGSSSGAVIEIADAGPGIPPQIRDRLFEPFVRGDRTSSGSGLGLHLVRQIAIAHGAEIAVDDGHPNGTVFSIRFDEV